MKQIFRVSQATNLPFEKRLPNCKTFGSLYAKYTTILGVTMIGFVSRRKALGLGFGAAIGASGASFLPLSYASAQDQGFTPPPLSAYGKLPAIEDVVLSPSGTHVALLMTKDGQRLIFDYDLETGQAAAAAIEKDKIRNLFWIDDEYILVHTTMTVRDVGRVFENSYAMALSVKQGKRRQLYTGIDGAFPHAVSGNFNRVKMEGKVRITASGYRKPDGLNQTSGGGGVSGTETYNTCLYAFSLTSDFGSKLDEGGQSIDDWAVRSDASIAARSEYDDEYKSWKLKTRDGKGWKTIYDLKVDILRPSLVGLGRTPNTVLVYYNEGEFERQYVEVSLDGTVSAPFDLEGDDHYAIYSPSTNLLLGFGNSGALKTFTYFDPAMQALPTLIEKALPHRINRIKSYADNPKKVLVYTEGNGDSGSYYFFDFDKGSYKKIGSAYPNVPEEWISNKDYYTYKAADGLEIPSFVTLPPDRDPKMCACVVMPHGGPQVMEDSSFDWMAQALTSRGYVVLQPNFRGSDGYGEEFTAKGYGEWGRKMQTDLSDGVADLVKKGIVDPKRVCIAGASYGGYAAMAGVSLQSGIYNCAVAMEGVSDPKTMLKYVLDRVGYDYDATPLRYWRRFMGDESRFDEISPLKNAQKVNVPILFTHGKDDVVVPPSESEQMHKALLSMGKSSELLLLDGDDHWMSIESSRLQLLEAMVAFIEKHNPAGPGGFSDA